MTWIEIRNIKAKYLEQLKKAQNTKNKKTAEKYRDKAQYFRRMIAEELIQWDFSGLDFKQLNVMAPGAGPYCLVDAYDFKVEKNLGSMLHISFCYESTRYAGYVHWVDDKCGIDNMKLIA